MNPARTAAAYAVRVLLFVYVLILLAPFHFLPFLPSVDNTWEFALNWGAAHGLAMGRDLVWTTGPLWYLSSPQDIGNNVMQGLAFQWVEWAALGAIFADLFFACGFALPNVAAFTVFFGLSAPLYAPDSGSENRLVAGALALLVAARWRGGRVRYVAALVLAGLVPLIKMTGGILLGGAILGYVVDDFWRRGRKAWVDAALAAVVPAAVAIVACRLAMPSFKSILEYALGSAAISGGYSAGMSVVGDTAEVAGAAVLLAGPALLLYFAAKGNAPLGRFFGLLLPLAFFLSFKHSFVRQDVHAINLFCFTGLAMGLISLAMAIEGRGREVLLLAAAAYTAIWLDYIPGKLGPGAYGMTDGSEELAGLRQALDPGRLRARLRATAEANFPPARRLEPELRAMVGDAPVGEMALIYSSALADGLNLKLFPVVQRYAAFTAYLDQLNARWLREQGPRFLIADWASIDGRHPFAETPAMWTEAYRWYDTRKLAGTHVLLERRSRPRFSSLRSIRRFDMRVEQAIEFPVSEAPVFFSVVCGYRAIGTLRKMLLRIAPVAIDADGERGDRVPMEALGSPGMGSDLPGNLKELAALFGAGIAPNTVKSVSLGGPGLVDYGPVCRAELLTPVN